MAKKQQKQQRSRKGSREAVNATEKQKRRAASVIIPSWSK